MPRTFRMLRMLRMLRMPTITRGEDVGAGSGMSFARSFFIVTVGAVALLAFAGCGLPTTSTQAKPTATPTAQQILTKAQSAHLTDETFTLTVQGTSNGTTLSVTGSGKATENPARVAMSLSTEVSGTTVALDEVIDGATSTSYTKITAPASLATDTWTKTTSSSGPISGSDLQVLTQYSKISNPKLIGKEQVNGVDTYHIQGDVSGGSGTIDVYIRQSDYLPAKMALHSTGDAAIDVAIIYTAVNTGISIDLPAA
jgi:hypothetical protein